MSAGIGTTVRRGMLGRLAAGIRHHPVVTAAIAASGVALLVVVLVWFQPQKLFIDTAVSEAAPAAQGQAAAVATGDFRALAHGASGRASLLELRDGSRVVRFEDFAVENGPDLFVYLSAAPAGSSGDAFDDEFVNLGKLKGNVGPQNYSVPAGARFRSVVIWCRRLRTGFAVAPLEGGGVRSGS